MTLNGVGSKTASVSQQGDPAANPRPARTGRGPTERGAAPRCSRASGGRWVHQGGRALKAPRASTAAAAAPRPRSARMPRAPLLRLLLAVSAAAAVAGEPGTALPPTTGDATLAIVLDVTGSMWDDLMQVMHGASRILERSLSRGSQAIGNYALVPFRDPGSVPPRPRRRPPRPGPAPWRGALSRPHCAPGALDARRLHRGPAGAPSRRLHSARARAPGAGLAAAGSFPREPALPFSRASRLASSGQ